jgi:drug/metabolite transporter (DMT)-like permease
VKRALWWCLLANVIGGTTFAAMGAAHASGLPTLTFSFARTLLSTLLFALLAWRHGELRPRFAGRDLVMLFLVAVPGFAMPLVLGIRGVALSSAGLGSILSLLEPVMIVPLSLLFLRERMAPSLGIGLALGLAGALLVIGADSLPGHGRGELAGSLLVGNLLLAAQSSLWAIYTVAAKPLTARHSVLSISTWSTALGCLVMGLLAPLEWESLRPAALEPLHRWLALETGPRDGAAIAQAWCASLPWMAYLAVFGSFLGVLLWNAGLKGVPASRMAAFIFIQPAVGLLLDFALGAPAPALFAWIGLGLIGAAVLFVSRERSPTIG